MSLNHEYRFSSCLLRTAIKLVCPGNADLALVVRYISRVFRYFVLGMFFNMSTANASWINCAVNEPQKRDLNFGSVDLSKFVNSPVGTEVAKTYERLLVKTQCNEGTYTSFVDNLGLSGSGLHIPGINGSVFKLGDTGVGVVFSTDSCDVNDYFAAPFTKVSNQRATICQSKHAVNNIFLYAGATLYKIANISPPRNPYVYDVSLGAWYADSGYGTGLTAKVTILPKKGSCKVKQQQKTIDLGGSQFANDFPAIGAESMKTKFDLSLDCESDTKVMLEIKADTVNNNPDTIALTSSSDSASGLGVALYDDKNQRVKLNKALTIKSSSVQGNNNFSWYANYIRTGALKPGKADAVAVMNFTYN